MAYIFSKFLKGLQYLATLPLLVVVLSIVSVIGIFMFVFIGIKAIFLYFSGRNIFGEFPEDIKAREIINRKMKEQEEALNPQPVPQPIPQQPINQYIFNNVPLDQLSQNIRNMPVEPQINQIGNNVPPTLPVVENEGATINDIKPEPEEINPQKPIEIKPIDEHVEKEDDVTPSIFEQEPEEKNVEEINNEDSLDDFIPRYEDIAPKKNKNKGNDNLIDPLSYRGMNYDREDPFNKKGEGDK